MQSATINFIAKFVMAVELILSLLKQAKRSHNLKKSEEGEEMCCDV